MSVPLLVATLYMIIYNLGLSFDRLDGVGPSRPIEGGVDAGSTDGPHLNRHDGLKLKSASS